MTQLADRIKALAHGATGSMFVTIREFMNYGEGFSAARARAAELAAEQDTQLVALQERFDFLHRQCRDAQDIAADRGWALHAIAVAATSNPAAKKTASEALLGRREDLDTRQALQLTRNNSRCNNGAP